MRKRHDTLDHADRDESTRLLNDNPTAPVPAACRSVRAPSVYVFLSMTFCITVATSSHASQQASMCEKVEFHAMRYAAGASA